MKDPEAEEESLHNLLRNGINVALESVLRNVDDHDLKSTMKRSLDEVLDDCRVSGELRRAQTPSKKRKRFGDNQPVDDGVDELKESILLAENCINRLKTESDTWEILLDSHRNKAELASRPMLEEKVKIKNVDSENMGHLEDLAIRHERLRFHMKELTQSASILAKLCDMSERRLNDTISTNYLETDIGNLKQFLCDARL